MFALLPFYYRIALYCIFLAACFAGGYFFGWRGEHDALVQFKAQVTQQAADQSAHVALIEAAHAKLLEDTKNDYENRLAANTNYWKRVLQSATSPYSLSKSSQSAVSAVAATANTLPDSAPVALPQPSQLVMDCQSTTVQLEALQTWVKNSTVNLLH